MITVQNLCKTYKVAKRKAGMREACRSLFRREYEEIHVWNVTNGKRFATYAIRGEDNSGIISVNGGAAHQADVGDLVIIATFGDFTQAEANAHKPRLVYANPNNTVNHTANCIPVQVA